MSSCELRLHYKISNFPELKSYLGLEGGFLYHDDLSNTSIGSEDSGKNKCHVSISTKFLFLCIAKGSNAIFLQGKTQVGSESSIFECCWRGQTGEESDTITSILCIPIASNKQSSFGEPDWFCIIVGFKSGKTSFYTESGLCLMSCELHLTPVIDIQFCSNTQFHLENKHVAQSSDINIVFENGVVVINGQQLFHDLRVYRTQLAVASAYGTQPSYSGALSFKKIQFVGQKSVSGFLKRSLVTLSLFDDLQSLTINGGYNAQVSVSSSCVNEMVTTGSNPYLGFFLQQDEKEFQLSHVASAVASKLKTALYSAANNWWNWKQKEIDTSKDEHALEMGTPVDIAYGMPDSRRCGNSLCLAPGCNWLAAVTDSFGRVVLLDVADGYILRMWKGYRDAQVLFTRVFDATVEDEDKKYENSSLFLLLYAPKRGILEVWCCINGPRVAAFNIRKSSRLLRIGGGMLGLSPDQLHQHKHLPLCCVMSDDGTISLINIPFHVALSDSTSNRARHIHLLKKMNSLLHSRTGEKEIINLILQMDISSFQQQALEKLIEKDFVHCNTIRFCVETILARLRSQDLIKEERDFQIFLSHIISVIEMYETVMELNRNSKSSDASMRNIFFEEMEKIESVLKEKQDVFSDFYQFVDVLCFQENHELSVSNALEYFACDKGQCNLEKWIGDSVHLKKIGNFLFSQCLNSAVSPESILSVLIKFNKFAIDDLLTLLMSYWLETETGSCEELLTSTIVLLNFLELLCIHSIKNYGSFNCTKSFTQILENICQERISTPACYMAVYVCEELNTWQQNYIKQVQKKNVDPVNGSDDSAWNAAINRVDDCLHLNVLLAIAYSCNHPSNKIPLASLVCVSDVLNNGKGHIPELISKALQNSEISCNVLYSNVSLVELSKQWKQFTEFWRSHMLKRFQFCLSENTLLSHCVWDQVVEWNKTPSHTSYLMEAISSLKLIKNARRLQHGLALMAWRAFINTRAGALANLVEKFGRLPKDRQCVKEVGIHTDQMFKFAHCCYEILHIIGTSDPNHHGSFNQPDAVEILSGYDSFQHWSAISKKESIVEIAEVQPPSNTFLTNHRLCYAMVLTAIIQFKMHGLKASNDLFGSKVSHILFSEIPCNDFIIADEKQLKHTRTKIFCCILTQALKQSNVEESTHWYNLFKTLEHELLVNVHQLTEHYVEQLFKSGMDEFAYKFLKMISHDLQIADVLLTIIGKRIALYLKKMHPSKRVMMMSQISPPIVTWINEQSVEDVSFTELDCCRVLANFIVSLLQEDDDSHKFVVEVLNTLSTLSSTTVVPNLVVD